MQYYFDGHIIMVIMVILWSNKQKLLKFLQSGMDRSCGVDCWLRKLLHRVKCLEAVFSIDLLCPHDKTYYVHVETNNCRSTSQ